jgi:hypothetical protein
MNKKSKTPSSKPRNTPLKKMRALLEADIAQATNLASFGRELSWLESEISFYRVWKQSLRAKLAREIGVPVKNTNNGRGFIEDKFFRAIETGDASEIHAIADALTVVKTCEEILPKLPRAKKWRTLALMQKRILDFHGKKMPIKQLAKLVGVETHEIDNKGGLREICREIHFPLLLRE